MKNKFKTNFKNVFKNSILCLKYIGEQKKGFKYFLYKSFQSILNVVFQLITLTMPGMLINYLIIKPINYNNIIVCVLILILVPLFSYFINLFIRYKIINLKQSISLALSIKFYRHSFKLDYEIYENADLQVLKDRSKNALNQIWSVSDILFGFLSQIISLTTIIAIISFLNPLLVVIIICSTIVVTFLKNILNKKLFELDKKCSMLDRKKWGATYMLEHIDYGKEIRLFKLEDLLISQYENLEKESIKLDLKYIKLKNIPDNVNTILTLFEKVFTYIFLILQTINEKILVGNFTIYLSYYTSLKTTLINATNSFIELSRISLNIDELNCYMEYPIKISESGNRKIDYHSKSIIEFKNVSFKYPGTENYALKNISIQIMSNQKLCIVGDNGAGKSTFIKLLTRLYEPTEGQILLNGINICEYDYDEYLSLFSPVFQDFVKYYMSFGENIALSKNINYDKLDKVIQSCGLDNLVDKLPRKYDTSIDKWIDPEGVELSGGEKQRIAIARALYRDCNIYILDEPTASLDPDAEYEIYNQFNNMVNKKTAIFITHRLSAVQLADVVVVFDKGNIIEYGTHDELIAINGKYYSMYEKQSKFYKNN